MTKTTIAIAALIAVVFATSTVQAADLPGGFDQPCPIGQSLLQETCVAMNDVNDEVETNTNDIILLNITLDTLIQDLIDAKGRITTAETTILDHGLRILVEELERTHIVSFSSSKGNGLATGIDTLIGVSTACAIVSPVGCFDLTDQIIPINGIMQNLFVRTAIIPTNDHTFTVYKNQQPTSLTCTITANTVMSCSDPTHTITVVEGDEITLANSVTLLGGAQSARVNASVALQP